VLKMHTNVLAEYAAAIFRVEVCVLWSVYVGTLMASKMHVICST